MHPALLFGLGFGLIAPIDPDDLDPADRHHLDVPAMSRGRPSDATPAKPPRQPLLLVHGGRAAEDAWLALWQDAAWVCWDAPADDCWQRIELGPEVDLNSLRGEFLDASNLVLGDLTTTWRISRGDPEPQPGPDIAPTTAPYPLTCSPTGSLPVVIGQRLTFRSHACANPPEAQRWCLGPAVPLRLRPVIPVGVRLGVEVRALDNWRDRFSVDHAAAVQGIQVLVTLDFTVQVAVVGPARRERANLMARSRPQLRPLPRPQGEGPVATAEREATYRLLCGADPQNIVHLHKDRPNPARREALA